MYSVEKEGMLPNLFTYRTPSSDYIPVQPNRLNFIDYTNDGAVLSRNPFEERITFWDNLLEEHELF